MVPQVPHILFPSKMGEARVSGGASQGGVGEENALHLLCYVDDLT